MPNFWLQTVSLGLLSVASVHAQCIGRCDEGYESVFDSDCVETCILNDPCASWNGMDTTETSVKSRSDTALANAVCEAYATECDDNQYLDFADDCIFTPPCPSPFMTELTDSQGDTVCDAVETCNNSTCTSDEVCIEHYGFHSCMSTESDPESCESYDLCGPNFIDGEIDSYLDTHTLDAIDERYQFSECSLDASQTWLISFQVPLFDFDGTDPSLYFEQHTDQVGFTNYNLNANCLLDLSLLIDQNGDEGLSDYSLNDAFYIDALQTFDTPLSGDDFASVDSWDNTTISGWLRGSVSVSLPHMYDHCGWGEMPVVDNSYHTELTARYLQGGNDVHVTKTCVFSVVTEEFLSYEGRTGLGISFNYWLDQYDPEVEAFGSPSIFYANSHAGMEVAIALTYNNVPEHMSVGPLEESGAWGDFFVFDSDTTNCYAPYVASVTPDWRSTEAFLNDQNEPAYCVGTSCRFVIYIRTDTAEVPEEGLDFAECILYSRNQIDNPQVSFTVLSNQCNGRSETLSECQAGALQTIRSDLGEYVSLNLYGTAAPQTLTYQFGAVSARNRELTKKQLERSSCVQLTAKDEEPWVKLATGLNDHGVCYDIAGEVCPGEYCAEEVDGDVCLFTYVKEHELIDGVYSGSLTRIDVDSIVVYPQSMNGTDLPSFSMGFVDSLDNTVLDDEYFLNLHTSAMTLLSRGMSTFSNDTDSWDSGFALSGMDGFCWDAAELVRFYAELQGSSFEPFKYIHVDFIVRYDYDGTSSRRLLSQLDIENEQLVGIDIDLSEIITDEFIYAEGSWIVVNTDDDEMSSSSSQEDIDRLEMQYMGIFFGLVFLFCGITAVAMMTRNNRGYNKVGN